MTQKRQEMLPDQGVERAADAELKIRGENMLEYMFSHSYWGLCAWDLPALAVLAVMMIIFMIHRHKMEKREEAFEEELAEREAEESGATERTC